VTRILVTGAGGMLGQDVVGAARRLGHDVMALARTDLDITVERAVVAALDGIRPDAVINCAAWTDVDGAETSERQAFEVNASGAGLLARAAASVGAHVVQLSTDYVFDGQARRPYVESDQADPRTAYGRTKLAGEQEVADADAGHAIVRTAWLFGLGGRNFVRTMLELAGQRDEVSVVADQIGCPTFTGHLAPALLELAERREPGTHHVAGADHCSWNEFAVEIFAQAGIDCRVLPVTSADAPRPAPRPAWSVLGSERRDPIVLPRWQEGLAAYLAQAREGAAL
jgi:dTDP-4-dehydrorhamnose reductase